jgi:hypothetical protein
LVCIKKGNLIYQEVIFALPTEKYCYVCKRTLPLSHFSINRTKKKELRPECKSCDNRQRQERKKKEKISVKERKNKYLSNKYDITLVEYETMKRSQENKCWICGSKKTLVVDHDHDTGKVRGLLCNLCNTSLGGFKDNVDSLKKAVEYLEVHSLK